MEALVNKAYLFVFKSITRNDKLLIYNDIFNFLGVRNLIASTLASVKRHQVGAMSKQLPARTKLGEALSRTSRAQPKQLLQGYCAGPQRQCLLPNEACYQCSFFSGLSTDELRAQISLRDEPWDV